MLMNRGNLAGSTSVFRDFTVSTTSGCWSPAEVITSGNGFVRESGDRPDTPQSRLETLRRFAIVPCPSGKKVVRIMMLNGNREPRIPVAIDVRLSMTRASSGPNR